jgi:hypothetical protein
MLLVQSISTGFWGWAGHRLPLKHHTRRCGQFHRSESIFDGASAKKSLKGPEGLETSWEVDFRHP